MKRYASIFMIFLAVFQFYSCTKDMTNPPIVTNNPTLNFTYLDETRNPVERRTDKIAMKLDNPEAENILMMSEKSGENEYTTYITDEKTGYVISFVYKNNAMFPEKIIIFTGTDMVFGTPTKHRETEDFDIIWRTGDDANTFKNVPLKNTIYSYTPYKQLDSTENYQVKNIMTSVKIWAAISGYIDTNIPNSMARGLTWDSFWRGVAAIFVIVVTIFVAVIVNTVSPNLANKIAEWGISTAAEIVGISFIANSIDAKTVTTEPDSKVIVINNKYEEKLMKDGDSFVLFYDDQIPLEFNTRNKLYLVIANNGANINNFSIKSKVVNGSINSYELINGYYRFFLNDSTTIKKIDENFNFHSENLDKLSSYNMRVEKINEDEDFKKTIYISFEVEDEDVMINDHITNSFRIYIR